jgi:acetoin utilization protein AcuC
MRLAHEFGLWNQPGVTAAAPPPAGDSDLRLVHDPSCISMVEAVSRWAEHPDARDDLTGNQLRAAQMFGLGSVDNPVFPGMHEASALVAGATLAAARTA